MTRYKGCFLGVLLAAPLFPGVARGDFIISAPAFSATPGSSDSFDILLQDTTPPIDGFSFNVAAFSFDISTVDPSITFTGASTMTTVAPYIYAGNSFAEINGFPLATKTGHELIASDTPNNGIAPVLPVGTTVSLGEVSYFIAPSATPGPVAITFSSTGTSLADQFGGPLAFTAINGRITVTVTPEPGQLSLLAFCLGVFLVARSRRRPG